MGQPMATRSCRLYVGNGEKQAVQGWCGSVGGVAGMRQGECKGKCSVGGVWKAAAGTRAAGNGGVCMSARQNGRS